MGSPWECWQLGGKVSDYVEGEQKLFSTHKIKAAWVFSFFSTHLNKGKNCCGLNKIGGRYLGSTGLFKSLIEQQFGANAALWSPVHSYPKLITFSCKWLGMPHTNMNGCTRFVSECYT